MRRTVLLTQLVAIALGLGLVAAQQLQRLQPNTPVQRPLAPKDAEHQYAVTASGNQALVVTVDQQGIDVVVTVLAPDGQQLMAVDGASDDQGTGGSEVARITALAPGDYHLRASPFQAAGRQTRAIQDHPLRRASADR